MHNKPLIIDVDASHLLQSALDKLLTTVAGAPLSDDERLELLSLRLQVLLARWHAPGG